MIGVLTGALGPGAAGGGGTPYALPAIFTNGFFPVNMTGNAVSSSGVATGFGSTYAASTFKDVGTTYYVRTTGNDTTGDGLTAGTAWRQIQKAHDTVAAGSIIDVGAGRFANFVQTKSLSVIGIPGSTFVGDLLANADVSAWGSLTSGRQTVTLTTGTVSGFVDLTKTKVFQASALSTYQVSKAQTSAASIATEQAAGNPGVFRSTPSSVGSSDSRDLTGTADTNIIMWRATAAAPYTVTGAGVNLYAYGLSFVGGAQCAWNAGTRVVEDNCTHLGAVGQCIQNTGSVSVMYQTKVRGSAVTNSDLIDYAVSTTARGVEIETLIDQGGSAGADNASTCHGNFIMRINGAYSDTARTIHDVGASIIGNFGLAVGGVQASLALGNSAVDGESHCSGITFLGTPIQGDIEIATQTCRAYYYDRSFVGKTVYNGGILVDRSGAKPTSDATLAWLNPAALSTLFQDTAGAIPVAADGDPVLRVNNNVGGSTDYWLLTGYVYKTDGAKFWLLSAGTADASRIVYAGTVPFEEKTNVVVGVTTTDTSWVLAGKSVSNYFGSYRGSASQLNVSAFVWDTGTPYEHHVDSGATIYTGASALNAALAAGGNPHILTVKNTNLSWCGWMTGNMLSDTTAWGYDGKLFGLQFSRATTDANLRVREQAMATLSGATLL